MEYGLFAQQSTDGLAPVSDRLMADVIELQSRVAKLTFSPEEVVGGAAVLLEKVAATKISGEEDRYCHTELWDFQGNIDGAQKIVSLYPLVNADDSAFVRKIDANFATVNTILAKYREVAGF